MRIGRREFFAAVGAALVKPKAITIRGVPIKWVPNLGDQPVRCRNYTSTYAGCSSQESLEKLRSALARHDFNPPVAKDA